MADFLTQALEALKGIVHIEKVELFNNIQIGCNNGNTAIYEDVENKTLRLDPRALSPGQKKEFAEKVAPLLLETRKTIIDNKSLEILESDEEFETDDLIFFKGILRDDDFKALRAAYVIQKKFQKNENVDELKDQLWLRYRKRGTNIADLYSAGYFQVLKDVYSKMAAKYGGKSNEKFLLFFDVFVANPPFVFFVSRHMTKEFVLQNLEEKIRECKKYGLPRLNVHAIGSANIGKAIGAINDLKKTNSFEVRFEEKEIGIFMAEITPA